MNFTDYELILISGCVECVLKAGIKADKQHIDALKDLSFRLQEYLNEALATEDEIKTNTDNLN